MQETAPAFLFGIFICSLGRTAGAVVSEQVEPAPRIDAASGATGYEGARKISGCNSGADDAWDQQQGQHRSGALLSGAEVAGVENILRASLMGNPGANGVTNDEAASKHQTQGDSGYQHGTGALEMISEGIKAMLSTLGYPVG